MNMLMDLFAALPSWLRLCLYVGAIIFGAALALFVFMSTYTLMYAVFGEGLMPPLS